MEDIIEFTRITNSLAKTYPMLMNYAATEAVNFFKERFVEQRDILDVPFKPRRTTYTDKKGRTHPLKNTDAGRAILVGKGSGKLKRDVQKIYVAEDYAIIGTTRITQGYAKAHNEGFDGEETVKAHTRRRFKSVKEKYTTKKGNVRTRTSKQVDIGAGVIQVGTFRRHMSLPKRQFMGVSPLLDKRVQAVVTRKVLEAIIKAK